MTDALSQAAIAISVSFELSILLKATIAMLLGLAAARLARRARASVRHALLASTFGGLLILPVALMVAPIAAIEIPVTGTIASAGPQTALQQGPAPAARLSEHVAVPASATRQARSPTWPALMRVAWATGFTLILTSLGVSLWRLGRLRRRAYPWPERTSLAHSLANELGLRRPVELVLHEGVAAPLTCGTWHPAVMLPSDAIGWSDADVRRALVHELEHVRRDDWALQLVARVTCALYWFHPLVWTLWREFCLEAERACDDAVLNGGEQADYAEQLVQLARRMSNAPMTVTLTMASRSDLSTRVSAILDGAQKRGPVGMLPAAAATAAAIVAVLAIAPLRAVGIPVHREADGAKATATAAQAPRVEPILPRTLRPWREKAVDRALYEAAEQSDLAGISALLNEGANVNAALLGDGSPLIGAARRGSPEAVRLLLDRGADPNMPVRGDGNALIAASRAGHVDIVKLLLDRGADIEQIVPDDENALIQASGSGRLNVATLLISLGANVNARVWIERTQDNPNGEWRSPLSMARRGRHEAMVQYLLSKGATE